MKPGDEIMATCSYCSEEHKFRVLEVRRFGPYSNRALCQVTGKKCSPSNFQWVVLT